MHTVLNKSIRFFAMAAFVMHLAPSIASADKDQMMKKNSMMHKEEMKKDGMMQKEEMMKKDGMMQKEEMMKKDGMMKEGS